MVIKNKYYSCLERFWRNLRMFAFYNRTLFELFFLILYTGEQGLLIFFSETFGVSSALIGYFSLIVLFTFALHKIVMESRMKLLDNAVQELQYERKAMNRKFKDLLEAYTKQRRVKRVKF